MGLAAPCDPPHSERRLEEVLLRHLPSDANTLPFVAFLTPDLEWVGGFSGYRKVEAFLELVEQAERSPVLNASAETVRQMEGLATQAGQAVERQDWKAVFAAGKAAAALKGRCEARRKVAAQVQAAREWADERLRRALDAGRSPDERPAARAALKKLAAAFAGEPEAKDAETGVRALERLTVLEGVPADKRAAADERAAREFDGTRWAALFRPAK